VDGRSRQGAGLWRALLTIDTEMFAELWDTGATPIFTYPVVFDGKRIRMG